MRSFAIFRLHLIMLIEWWNRGGWIWWDI